MSLKFFYPIGKEPGKDPVMYLQLIKGAGEFEFESYVSLELLIKYRSP